MRQLKITKSITNRESASLDKYLPEIGREELITVEEEVELAQRIRKGDQAALEKLTRANLRFVVSVAKQYQNQGLSLPDLINEGNLGLIKAAEKFDETRGFKFISYAVWWIRQSILQALAEQSRIVRLPLNQVGSLNKINKALSKFEQENERMPSSEELSEMIDVPKDKIADTLRVSGRHVSVDAPFVEGEDNSLLDVLVNNDSPSADRGLVNESLNKEIERALSTLDYLTCLLRNLYAGQEATVRAGHGTTDWFQIGKGVHQGCILSPCLFNLYAEYVMRNAGLEEAQAGIKIARRNISNLRYTDDTTLMAESEEELKSLLMKVKGE